MNINKPLTSKEVKELPYGLTKNKYLNKRKRRLLMGISKNKRHNNRKNTKGRLIQTIPIDSGRFKFIFHNRKKA